MLFGVLIKECPHYLQLNRDSMVHFDYISNNSITSTSWQRIKGTVGLAVQLQDNIFPSLLELAWGCPAGCGLPLPGGHWDDWWGSRRLHQYVQELPHINHWSVSQIFEWASAPQLCHPNLIPGAYFHLQSIAEDKKSVSSKMNCDGYFMSLFILDIRWNWL